MAKIKEPINGGMLYCLNEDNELLQASAVTAPDNVDLSKWIEFATEKDACDYFGIDNSSEGD